MSLAPGVSDATLDTLFRTARTHNAWSLRPVTDGDLRALFDLMKWGPTSANCQPMRVVFVRSQAGKEKLRPALAPGNVDKTMSAPVVAIFGNDFDFYTHMGRMFPHNPGARSWFEGNAEAIRATAERNGTLQAGYMLIAARALGLDCAPMSGFDNAKVDAEFFAGTSVRSNFICALGHGDASKLHPRGPRFAFDEVCRLV